MGDNLDSPSEVMEIISNSSLYDFVRNEENCDLDSLFSEITKLTKFSDDNFPSDENRAIEDILREAETLIRQPLALSSSNKLVTTISAESTPLEIKDNNILDQYDYSTTLHEVSIAKNNFIRHFIEL